MSRAANFRKADVARAIAAARAAGIANPTIKIELPNGSVLVIEGDADRSRAPANGNADLDRELADWEKRRGQQGIPLRASSKVTAKGRTYYYAWRGGPRLRGEPGSPEFHASYVEAHAELRAPDPVGSTPWSWPTSERQISETRARHTASCGPWLDRVAEHFGDLRIAQFERTAEDQADHHWLAQPMGRQPRTADRRLRSSRACCRTPRTRSASSRAIRATASSRSTASTAPTSSGRRPTSRRSNAHARPRSRTRSISPRIRACAFATCPSVVGRMWARTRSSSRRARAAGRRSARVPLYDDLRAVLARIPKRSTTVLTNSLGPTVDREQPRDDAFTPGKNAAGFAAFTFTICAARRRPVLCRGAFPRA